MRARSNGREVPGDPAAANGFGRRSLNEWEGRLLYEAGYPAPPDMRTPQTWHLSVGGVPVPPLPVGADLLDAIQRARAAMSDEDRADPQWSATNYEGWRIYFQEEHDREMAAYEGLPPVPRRQIGRAHV